MSHGHLSKMERGEHGRPVTSTIVAAYEKVTGVNLAEAAAGQSSEPVPGRRGRSCHPGQLTGFRRRGYDAAIAALSVGGSLGEPYLRLLDATGRPVAPAPPQLGDVLQLERLTNLFTALDRRFGGGAGQPAVPGSAALVDAHVGRAGDGPAGAGAVAGRGQCSGGPGRLGRL
jgi:hypothetical protein